jgi:hypothetical protein
MRMRLVGGVVMSRMSSAKAPQFHVLPTTPVGWWALRFAGASVLVMSLLPLQAIPYFGWVIWGLGFLGLPAVLVGGVLALAAIIRDKERALSVFAAFIPLVFLVVLFVVELSGVGPEH